MTEILDDSAVSEIEARLDQCAHTGRPFTTKWSEVKLIVATIKNLRERLTQLQKWQGDVEEREAAVCPEDVGFDEYIRYLQSQLEQLRAENVSLRKEVANSEKYQAQLLDSDSQAASRGWSSIETAPQNETLLLFAPKERLYSKETIEAQPDLALDEMKVARPRDWTWATHWQRVHPPESNNEH